MPVTINLGRINTCKIVGTKNRFIETRCKEEPVRASWDCDPQTGQCIDYGLGTGQYTDANSGGNPGDGLAACIAAPAFSNTCGALTDSGVVNITANPHYDWLAANGHHAVDVCTFYFESMSGTIFPSSCVGPNGGVYIKICSLNVYDGTNTIVYTTNTINDLVTYLGTQGVTINATDTVTALTFAINTSTGALNGGTFGMGGSQCACTGCGSPSGVSFDCVQGAAGPVCQDPGTGNGQYATLGACNTALAAGGVNSCDTNAVSGGTRVNASAGMIFATEQDAIEYYTNPANGISGTDASTLFFEIAQSVLSNPCTTLASNTSCCEGPNSTAGSPTYMFYMPYLYIHYGFNSTMGCMCQSIAGTANNGNAICDCCSSAAGMGVNNQPISTLTGNCYPAWATSADYNGVYGMNDLGVIQSWSWDELLTDAIAAGMPVTMSTPYMVGGNVLDPAAFTQIVWDHLDTNPNPDPDPNCHNCSTNNACYQTCPNANPWGGYTACSRPIICLSGEVCECEASCTEITYDCDPHTQQCYDPFPLVGLYTGPTALADCQAAGCKPSTPSWDCVNGNCQDPGNGTGQHTTYADCIATNGINLCNTYIPQGQPGIPDAGITGLTDSGVFDAAGTGALLDWIVANPTALLRHYYYEVDPAIPCGSGCPDCCVGPNGGILKALLGIYIGVGTQSGALDCRDNFNTCQANGCGIVSATSIIQGSAYGDTWNDVLAYMVSHGAAVNGGMTYAQVQATCDAAWGPMNAAPLCSTWRFVLNGQSVNGVGSPCSSNCQCSECGSEEWECVPGAGCILQAGGQYLSEAACNAANVPTDSCDTTTVVPTPQINPLAAALELTTNYPTIDVTTLSTQIVAGANPCRPPLLANQTHCIGKEGHPMYTFTGYTFIDGVTGGALTGLVTLYTKWSDFLTAAQAIPIAGISGSTTFDDACAALQSHYNVTPTFSCPTPLTTDVVPGTWNPGLGANGIDTSTGLIEYISTPGNTYVNKNGAPTSDYTWIVDNAYSPVFCGTGGCSLPAGSNCDYMMGPYFSFINFAGPNGPFYYSWSDVLTDLIAIGIPGITSTSTWCDVSNCSDSGFQGFLQKFNGDYDIAVTFSPCNCVSTVVQARCSIETECCVCEDGCPPVRPPSRGECLTLWLNADRIDTIVTTPTYPVFPPNLGGTTYYIKEWHNLAYDINVGVYPHDPTAFYTWDTITPDFTTAPILDLTTFAPRNAIMFDEGFDAKKFLIANPGGPAVLPLEPDTNPNTAYDKGWTIFFRRCTTQKGWINAKSWFMGDDWTQTTPGSKQKASGLKPAGQPYCRSVMLGHNHADESTPDNQYEASYINENNPGGGELYLPEGCYTHWIKACETKPTGTTNNTFNVTWGIGTNILFHDVLKDVNMDMILQNINTRNRDKDSTQSGWYQEIRAYNCCFDKDQIKTESTSINNYWGNSLIPQQLPAPCGDPLNVGNVIKFDGVDQTRVEVVEAFGNESILPSNAGFTAAFWVRMDDCVDEDACFFEKGINLPGNNEEVSFRLYLTDDPTKIGKLYWDVFGDAPVSYLGNYSRVTSSVAWLGESSCANLIGKWKHVAVTMEGIQGREGKIYINGVDVTGPSGGSMPYGITGKVKRNSNYPFVIGDSSRDNYTFKGEFSQFMTWNKSLSLKEINDVYNNGGMFDPDVNTPSTFAEILGQKPYEDKDRLTFYTNFDSDPITHETQHPYTITKYGGVTLENTTDVVNAVLPTDIPNLQCWFRAGTKQLFDLDGSLNKISRATYMLGNTPRLKDKIRIWECHGNTGRYCMPDSVNTPTDKMLYQQSTAASAIVEPGGLYTNGSKQLQIFHTRADGGLDFPAADGTLGAFTIMVKIRLEDFTSEAIYGNTTDNMMRINNTTTVRYKIGGAGSADFTTPSAMTDAQPYIFTLQRDAAGNLKAYIDGGAFTDQLLTGSFTDTDAFIIDYIGGVPSQGMEGWVFDFIAWKTLLNDAQRKAQYRTINETIRTL